ncbi:MAG: Pyruvate kinase [Holosporales bacterium]
MRRNAKIIATLGPASQDLIEELFLKGVDVFRLNFSHGKAQDHKDRIEKIREIEKKHNRPIAIMLDLQGPKLRIGLFEKSRITLTQGEIFRLDQDPALGNVNRVCLPHVEIFSNLHTGQHILLDDGKIKLKVIETGADYAITHVVVGGELSNQKGVNVPQTRLSIGALTEKDKQDLAFGLDLGVDWVALSFVQHPDDIRQAKALIKDQAKLIAKLEKPQAIDELDAIVYLSDAVMVARGDLGVEMLPEDVPVLQKKIIQTCHMHGRPVIVATQMMESMIHSPTPTRAEASDVATAVYEGADAVMLSAETAVGKYPLQTVEMMDRVIRRSEEDYALWKEYSRQNSEMSHEHTQTDALVEAVHSVSYTLKIKSMVVYSLSGYTILRVARSRPKTSILGLTTNLKTYRYLNLVWGVHPLMVDEVFDFKQMTHAATCAAKQDAHAKQNDMICIVSGVPFGESSGANIVHLHQIK